MTDSEPLLAAADSARPAMRKATAATRADWLDAVADALDAAKDDLVALAQDETHLPEARLTGELGRTTFQARLFAEGLRDGELTPVRVDPEDPGWGMGPRPELRRTLVPIGPVLVFAAGNFPFAFSVFGGDTVSALAAGCPVVLKAHPGHPRLSRRTAEVVIDALGAAGAPEGAFGLLEGVEESITALRDPRIRAAGFTGSTAGGRALFDIAAGRPDPIPFYGELGSVNPVVVTPSAWAERGTAIAGEWVGSLTLGAGQFCTNPGVVLVPDADAFVAAVDLPVPARMLSESMEKNLAARVAEVAALPAVHPAAQSDPNDQGVRATVLAVPAPEVMADPRALEVEMFGPAGLVVGYSSQDELDAVLRLIPGQLTGTIQAHSTDDDPVAQHVVSALEDRAGRIVYNAWPTGVTVSGAQHHGGPWPSTTAPTSTSVGLAAIARWQRPVTYQGAPASVLPPELR
ncbi:NADP-dependent aldehyde dehydrogenase [Catenuloplanes nepalensis]|uniref:NADP-dependent aldehyde dehydrogenase n=1 Tax=Catenuloplanes nepalensis TaxID=587533 RepID=A0ABT9MXC4_9ACTN|nr:aldehyde dehydrogenase (NADP(+)) [Catenuloplanes nepalensis]MDP9796039.1 NADP-dependent aldehyde dehydrogenase [Catenuloplanes nepalensis]